MPADKRQDNPLWAFMLSKYKQPLIAEACLQLQQEQGVDVILLLFVIYCAEQGLILEKDGLAQADKQLKMLREQLILPLRQVRIQCKHILGEGDIYQQLKAQELALEWQQCQRLWFWLQQQSVVKNINEQAPVQRFESAMVLISGFYNQAARPLTASWRQLLEQLY